MSDKKYDNLKLLVELGGKKIFEGGWHVTQMPSDITEIIEIHSIIDKYQEHLFGFIQGFKHHKKLIKD